MEKNLTIHNSTAEFLIFQAHDKSQGMEVVYYDDTIWATQKAMSVLFDCSTDNIGLHLKNIFASGELKKESVTEKISATASDGKKYQTQFYNLDVIISVGYCVNSIRAPSSASGDLVLDTSGYVSADYANEFAETEFEKNRIIQDRLFQSDFDRLMNRDDLLELPEAES